MLHDLVEGRALDLISIVKILDSDKLLKSSTSKCGLLNKTSFSTHNSVRSRGRVHEIKMKGKLWGIKSIKITDLFLPSFSSVNSQKASEKHI